MPISSASRLWIILALGATMANAAVGTWLQLGPWRPDLLLAALIYLGLTSGPAPAVAVGFLAGIYQDLYAPQILGIHALAHTITGYVAGVVGEKVQAEHITIQAVALFALTVLDETIVGATLGLSGLPGFLLVHAVVSALYTTILGVLLVSLLGDWLQPREWGRHHESRRRRVR
jgi:rod shape-determining protein MreD